MFVFGVVLESSFDQALDRVKDALSAEALGVVSEFSVGDILRDKLGEDIGSYCILGACAPRLAKRVIDAQAAAGVLLPCNLVVRSINENSTAVDFMDPVSVLSMAKTPEINQAAEEAKAILIRVRDRLAS
jgi:uncharacterized protein (DUF302 family)